MPTDTDDEASAVDGNAALDGDDADAADAIPAEYDVAQPREVAADTEVAVAAAAVPARGGSTRVGSIQSDSPKGAAQKRCVIRETADVVGFSDLPRSLSIWARWGCL